MDVWLRARAVLGYIAGQRAVQLAEQLEVGESSVRDWLRWYARQGADGLLSAKRGASKPKLGEGEREELGRLLDAGPQAAGLSAGMWTGKLVAALILERFGVSYHVQSVPRLLHQIGFSVQRPRKRLARADPDAQAQWKADRLRAIKKKRSGRPRPALPGCVRYRVSPRNIAPTRRSLGCSWIASAEPIKSSAAQVSAADPAAIRKWLRPASPPRARPSAMFRTTESAAR